MAGDVPENIENKFSPLGSLRLIVKAILSTTRTYRKELMGSRTYRKPSTHRHYCFCIYNKSGGKAMTSVSDLLGSSSVCSHKHNTLILFASKTRSNHEMSLADQIHEP